MDTDRDGIPNGSDSDDDNDGLVDDFDAFPLDPDETVDTDGDGTGDNADADDDNDGVDDADDAFPLDPDESADTDGDGIGDNADLDDDNDGTPDQDDPYPLDPERIGEPVQVPDPALRAALYMRLREMFGKGKEPSEPLYAHELARVNYLHANDAGIRSLEGIQFATGLQRLYVWDNQISDLEPISGLVELRTLGLSGNPVSDLQPISGLVELRTLDLNYSQVSDLEPISQLAELTHMALANSNVEDLRPLSGLTALVDLQLFGNRLSDLSPLAGLGRLRELDVSRNPVRDLSPLRSLPELRRLSANNVRTSDTSWLADLADLELLQLSGNGISDLSQFSHLSKLDYLTLYTNQIVDIFPLAELPALRRLFLGWNWIEDLTPLRKMTQLVHLDITGNPTIKDFTPLSSLTSLTGLALRSSQQFTDLGVLSELTRLEVLNLQGNRQAYDLEPISNLVNLGRLNLEYNQISDVTPLAGLMALHELELRDNELSDLSPLAGLTALNELDLRYNRIEDIAPLAGNPGFEAGDSVDVRFNPLSPESVDSHVPALAERGVEVAFDAFAVRAADGPRIHNGNLFVLPVPGNIATDDSLPLDEFAQRFYAHFEDAFDFLMFISNVVGTERRSVSRRYAGRYYTVANDTHGLGLPDLARHGEFGSSGRLQGVIEFPLAAVSIERGPALHEVMHRWANYVVAPHPHWGFTSAFGQLGGFRAERLTDWGGGRYTAGSFGLAANGGNGVPYSPIELYLAGFIPPGEVPDLLIAEDARWLFEDDGATTRLAIADNGQPIFTATRVSRRLVEDLVAEQGIRAPDHAQSQRAFRAAAILLIDETHPAYADQLDQLSEEVAWFANAGDDGNDDLYNFHEATGGRATMAMGGLSEFNTGVAVPSTPVRISARSARARDVQDAPDEPRPGRLFQELEGSPRWPQVPEGHSGPAGPHGAWCRHESHAGLRIPSALKATGAKGS